MTKPAPRLHVESDLAEGAAVSLDKPQAHYLGTVLRLKEGGEVLLFNGRDGEWRGLIDSMSRKEAVLSLQECTRPQEAGPDLTLLFAPLKKGPTDLVIQKGTELGVARFMPVMTERTQSDRVKVERLRAIAIEAAEQCERLDVPVIDEPLPLEAALEKAGPVVFCDEAGDDPAARWGGGAGRGAPILKALAQTDAPPRAILIGPEGGFTPAERTALRQMSGNLPVTLGPRILKAETAAMAAVSLWGAAIGDLSDGDVSR